MSDLFASLVDRALDRAPVVQRRQPTLFERGPDSSFDEEGREHSSRLEEEEIDPKRKPAVDEQKNFVNEPSRLPRTSLLHVEPESQPVEARPARKIQRAENIASPSDRDTRAIEPVGIASRKDTARPVSPEESHHESRTPLVAEPQEITMTPVRSIETIVERRIEREIIKEPSTSHPTIKEVQTFTQPSPQQKPAQETESVRPPQPLKAEVKKLTPPKEHASVRRIVEPKASLRPEAPRNIRAASRAEPKQAPKEAQQPVIHVTIGRVEVRATSPAAKSRAAQPVGPRLSLDDYLRSRGERK